MTNTLRGIAATTLSALALAGTTAAQEFPHYPSQTNPAQSYPAPPYQPQNASPQPAPSSNPVCVRLEAQLATINSSASNTTRAAQIKRQEDAIARQQADIDRTLAKAHRIGCAGEGFFSLFSGLSVRCGPLTSQIQQKRGNLDGMMSELEQLKSGTADQEGQRTALIAQLAQNDCGAQYTAAAREAGPQGFFAALFGGGTIVSPEGNGAPAGTYQTVCVRTCDGFYFPISYSTVPARFAADALACQRLCPAAEVALYTYRNPGEGMAQAVSVSGAPYTALPNAFRYRKDLVTGCACRRPGQDWAEALRGADTSTTLERGDIVVTDKNAKALSQGPQRTRGRPQSAASAPQSAGGEPQSGEAKGKDVPAAQDNGSAAAASGADKNRKVRIIGPPFLPSQ